MLLDHTYSRLVLDGEIMVVLYFILCLIFGLSIAFFVLHFGSLAEPGNNNIWVRLAELSLKLCYHGLV